MHLYRPFSIKYFMNLLPKTVNKICVLDRTKEPGSLGEPLYLDVRSVFYDQKHQPLIIGGINRLSSKDVTPAQIIAIYDNLTSSNPKKKFTVGINDDVTFRSIEVGKNIFEAIENGANGLEEVIVDSRWLEYKSEDLVLSS